MAKIAEILSDDQFDRVVETLCQDTMKNRNPREYFDEYNGKRTRRLGSVGFRKKKKITVYSETEVDADGNPVKLRDEYVDVARFVTNYPKKIVRTAVAFMFGGEMSLTAKDSNDGYEEFRDVYLESMKMHSVLKRFARYVLSETKAAIIFFPVVRDTIDGKEIKLKTKVLHINEGDEDDDSAFYPHFDDDDDMDAFIYKYRSVIDDRACECVKIYTADTIYTGIKSSGEWSVTQEDNMFGIIPVVYAEVSEPEWDEEAKAIDSYEMRMSRIIDTNDYFADPMTKTFGLANLPSKETVGKEVNFPMQVDPDTGTTYHGDMEYLCWQQSVESVQEELQRTKSEIESGTSTPDLSFDNLQKLGNLSGVARRFMLIDAEIKASENMEVFGPAVQRTIAVVKAGMINISHIKYAEQLRNNRIKAEFASVLPQDLMEDLQALETAQQFNSRETIIKNSPYTDDVQEELRRKKEDEKEDANNRIMPGLNFQS